jgi:CHAP domain
MSRRVFRSALGIMTAGALLWGSAPAYAQAVPERDEWRIRQEIVDKALAEVGAKETNYRRAANLFPKRYQLDGVLRPAEWCGVFAHWVWATAGVADRPSMTPAPGAPSVDQGHWATYWQKWGQGKGRWKPLESRDVEMGDVVVYGEYPAQSAHVGVVVEVHYDRSGLKATHVRTVEGNISDQVVYTRWRKVENLNAGGGRQASGFVSPF